jgi:hypothetical protein
MSLVEYQAVNLSNDMIFTILQVSIPVDNPNNGLNCIFIHFQAVSAMPKRLFVALAITKKRSESLLR